MCHVDRFSLVSLPKHISGQFHFPCTAVEAKRPFKVWESQIELICACIVAQNCLSNACWIEKQSNNGVRRNHRGQGQVGMQVCVLKFKKSVLKSSHTEKGSPMDALH